MGGGEQVGVAQGGQPAHQGRTHHAAVASGVDHLIPVTDHNSALSCARRFTVVGSANLLIHTLGVEGGGPALDVVELVAFVQQELGEMGPCWTVMPVMRARLGKATSPNQNQSRYRPKFHLGREHLLTVKVTKSQCPKGVTMTRLLFLGRSSIRESTDGSDHAVTSEIPSSHLQIACVQ